MQKIMLVSIAFLCFSGVSQAEQTNDKISKYMSEKSKIITVNIERSEPKTEVAKEYVELAKIESLSKPLLAAVVNVNMGMAIRCGNTMSWQSLFDNAQFRNYMSLVNSGDKSIIKQQDELVGYLCQQIQTSDVNKIPLNK